MSGQKIIDGLKDAVEGRGTTRVVHVAADLVERLRDQGKDAFAKQYSLGMWKLCTEAADEIERLRSALHASDAASEKWQDKYCEEAFYEAGGVPHAWSDRAKEAEKAVEVMVRQEKLLRGEIASLRTQLATAKENEHLANGTAELAMKHRDEAEAKLKT